jgi:hypothetical protein
VTVRIEAEVIMRETGDARGLEATFDTTSEALVEPAVPQLAAERLAVMATEKALKAMREDPEYALVSVKGPSPEVLARFGHKGGRR